MELGKVPPHDIEAEQAILGSMLTDKDAVIAAIEVLRDELGKPIVKTYNNFKQICIDYNVSEIKVSISHCKDYAVANSIAITKRSICASISFN